MDGKLQGEEAVSRQREGLACLEGKKFDQALRCFDEAIALLPPDSAKLHAKFLADRASVHLAQGDYDKAVEDSQAALDVKSDLATAHFRLGAAYFGKEKFDEAITSYEKTPKYDPALGDQVKAKLHQVNSAREVQQAINLAIKKKEDNDDWKWRDEASQKVNHNEENMKDRSFSGYMERAKKNGCGWTGIFRWGCQYLTENMYLKRYLTGMDLDLEVVDNCVNTLTLVNALVLTIPFSVMVDLGGEFWSNLYTIMETYGCTEWYDYYYTHVRNNLLSTLYFSIAAIIIAVFYYILRPDFPQRGMDSDQKKMLETMQSLLDFHVKGTPMDENGIDTIVERQFTMKKLVADYKFKAWWVHGRHSIFAIFLLTASAVISLLALSFQMIGIYMVPNDELCTFKNTPVITGFLGVSALVTAYCIVRLNQEARITAEDMEKLEDIYEDFHLTDEQKKAKAKKREKEKEKHGDNCCCFPERKRKVGDHQPSSEDLTGVMTGDAVDKQ